MFAFQSAIPAPPEMLCEGWIAEDRSFPTFILHKPQADSQSNPQVDILICNQSGHEHMIELFQEDSYWMQ